MSLEISHLEVSIKKTPILKDVNLHIEKGEFFCILGSSGCGKSTLLKTIAGFVQEQSGEIVLDGKELHTLPPQKRGTIIVFQDVRLFSNMTIGENVAFALRMQGAKKAERLKAAEKYLDLVHLQGFSGRYVDELSGGQAQRVAIARALAAEPDILLLDEPFAALDENLRTSMRELISNLHEEMGVTIVMVTHDQREALSLADRIAIMDRGRILQTGTPRSIYERPSSLEIARYFTDGDIVEGSVSNGIANIGGITFPCEAEDGKRIMIVRTNALVIEPGKSNAIVKSLEFRGQSYIATVCCDATEFHMEFETDTAPAVGSRIRIAFKADKVLSFPFPDQERI